MKRRLLVLLLLCSCATQRQAEKYFDKNPEELAAYVDKNEAYTEEYGETYAAKHFPPRLYAPAIYNLSSLKPNRLIATQEGAMPASKAQEQRIAYCLNCPPTIVTKTVYLQDTLELDSLHRELDIERMANTVIRQRLQDTASDRDYWKEMNRKKFWTLILMAIFALLYILFKILASRVKDTEV
ncbi:hypothetical protein [uncultured Pontibacter sp.]|uniref:hypothetical protein n=1 Tax=uncultured Pontibacter sp. TaxID=453356 RepID=UPI0026339A9D|nr:hypothetical protein [uncultured Pontibacter sp.]